MMHWRVVSNPFYVDKGTLQESNAKMEARRTKKYQRQVPASQDIKSHHSKRSEWEKKSDAKKVVSYKYGSG